MLIAKEIIYKKNLEQNNKFILAADIGGTNSNFGVFDNNLNLFLSIHYKSKEIKNFTDFFIEILNYFDSKYKIKFKSACIGVAGIIIEDNFVKPTNLDISIDIKELKNKSYIKEIFLINDFVALAYGLEKISQDKLIKINKFNPIKFANKALIGAGTGLGKAILIWNKNLKNYEPIPSEGGHADFVIKDNFELELINFIKENNKNCEISWETLLCGNGIINIFKFLEISKKFKILERNYDPNFILSNYQKDQCAKETIKLYSKFYARCAKNFALETLALGGLYIGGGIAANNLFLFEQKEFFEEFYVCNKLENIIKKIPIIIISDYNANLYGAAQFLVNLNKFF